MPAKSLYTKFRDFDPAQIRVSAGDDSELRQSLELFGWLEDLPALVDERGVTLVGHRRLRLAKELGIEPVVEQLTFGEGAEADAERIKLVLASNIGRNALTKDDRKHIAEYLYGEREWTMEAIAKVLNVSHQTIGRDLGDLSTMDKLKHAQTPTNPKGAGRPKGSVNMPPIKYESREVASCPVQIKYVQVTEDGAVDEAARMQVAEAAAEEVRDVKKRLEQEFEARVRAETQQRLDAIEGKMAEKLAAAHERVDRLRDELREKSLVEVELRKIILTLIQKYKIDLFASVSKAVLAAARYEDTKPPRGAVLT
jgi:predicted ArsR family transcriptional regulator